MRHTREDTIVMDKSVFQSLSRDEHVDRFWGYQENVTPVLLREILCDLAKTDATPSPEAVVKTLASKFLGGGGIINKSCREMCLASLQGGQIPMDGRIVLDEYTETEEGVFIGPTDGNRAIMRWARSVFGAEERWAAERLRKRANSFSLDRLHAQLRRHHVLLPRPRAISELPSIVDDILSRASLQVPIVDWLAVEAGAEPWVRHALIGGWTKTGNELRTDAPYAYHCARVLLLLLVGMRHKVLSARPTNRTDAEYLLYAPFCMVFVSEDRLHKQLAPIVLRSDQRFYDLRAFQAELALRRTERKKPKTP